MRKYLFIRSYGSHRISQDLSGSLRISQDLTGSLSFTSGSDTHTHTHGTMSGQFVTRRKFLLHRSWTRSLYNYTQSHSSTQQLHTNYTPRGGTVWCRDLTSCCCRYGNRSFHRRAACSLGSDAQTLWLLFWRLQLKTRVLQFTQHFIMME